jgi:hypothetical protein
MRLVAPTLIACGAFLLASDLVGAEPPENAITLTPGQMKWEDNPRVPGLGLAKRPQRVRAETRVLFHYS